MKLTCRFFILAVVFTALDTAVMAQVQTIVLRPGPSDGKGAELSTYTPSTPSPNSPNFDANAWTVGGIPITIRSLIEFDFSAIPAGADIISATLSLYCNPASGHYQLQSGENESRLLRITEVWNDHLVTWDTQPDVSLLSPVVIPTSTTNTQHYPDIDVSAHVRDMVNNPALNFGWEIRLITEELYRSMQFSSCHDLPQYRPMLTIKYISCDPPVAAWRYTIQDDFVHFSDSSSSSVYEWFWDFKNGYSSSLQNPVYRFPEFGKYPVCLTVNDSCGTNTFCDTVNYCPPVNTAFSETMNGLAVTFTDLSATAVSWYWSFGDGFYSDLKDPLHVFNLPGRYFVCLTAGNGCTSETSCDSVMVISSGMDENSGADFLVYPVPADERLFLQSAMPAKGSGNAVVTNLAGAVVHSAELLFDPSENKASLDVSRLPAGIYFLKLFLYNKVHVRKFIITHNP